MAEITKITGVDSIIRNLSRNTSIASVASRKIQTGLKRAGLFLQRESQKIVPIDTSALKNSAFTRATGLGWNTVVAVGYSGVNYAIFVHEDLDARHAPGKMAKFLEKPFREKQNEIRAIIFS